MTTDHTRTAPSPAEMFDAVVEAAPSSTALWYPQGIVTFGDLASKSRQVARLLRVHGVRPGSVVGIFHEKSPAGFAAMLACLRMGAAYVNLDRANPRPRLEKIFSLCEPDLILLDSEGDDRGGSLEDWIPIPLLALDVATLEKYDDSLLTEPEPVDPDAVAYIMFTSGSTGFPKGVAISRANVMNFIGWGRETFNVSEEDRFTNVNPLYFDNSVFDFYVSLFNGASLVPVAEEIVSEPQALVEYVTRSRATIWFSVPSLLVYLLTMRTLGDQALTSLRWFVFGGEGFPKPRLAELMEIYRDRSRFMNVYGPTECTCICSSYEVSEEDLTRDEEKYVPLGRLADLFHGYIDPLDDDPDEGELWLGGENVGLGYYNDPERTAESFVPHPVDESDEGVYYRTGDLVRRDRDGTLHFLGRKDFQVKHLGYRIELEEIEAALDVIPGVSRSGVVYQETRPGMGRIVAFVATESEIEEGEIMRTLEDKLPPYMLPKRIFIRGGLPRNRNGKIDRNRLLSSLEQR